MAGLLLVGEVVNLVEIYGSKVAEGFFRPLQLGLVPSMIVCNVSKEHEKYTLPTKIWNIWKHSVFDSFNLLEMTWHHSQTRIADLMQPSHFSSMDGICNWQC